MNRVLAAAPMWRASWRGVASNRKNWCLIVPSITEDLYIKLAASVKDVASERGANVILCDSEYSAEKQTETIKRLIMAGVDGFIIVPVITKNVEENLSIYLSFRMAPSNSF